MTRNPLLPVVTLGMRAFKHLDDRVRAAAGAVGIRRERVPDGVFSPFQSIAAGFVRAGNRLEGGSRRAWKTVVGGGRR